MNREELDISLFRIAAACKLSEISGVPTPASHNDLINLLSSNDDDYWTSGLYFFSQLSPARIRELFFNAVETYTSLATYIASEISKNAFEDRRRADFATLNSRLHDWGPPDELRRRISEIYMTVSERINASARVIENPLPATEASGRLGLIIHGTWATKKDWWKPRIGNFWRYIYQHWSHLYAGSSPFAWSGHDDHMARVSAARSLVGWVHANGNPEVDIIAHSHGGNVCLAAARLGLKINRLILLGMPIRTEYLPDLRSIRSIANVFSLGDIVQTPLGTFPRTRFEGRTLGDSEAVSNWRADQNGRGSDPAHSELHEPATWKASDLERLLSMT